MKPLVLLSIVCSLCLANLTVNININTDTAVNKVNSKYLSVTLDFSKLVGNSPLDLTQPDLINYAQKIGSHSYLRIGGTYGDMIYYDVQHTSTSGYGVPPPYTYSLYQDQIDNICNFAKSANFEIVFGLNGGPSSRSNDRWNSTNAASLMTYVIKTGCPIVGWELGNEPNLYPFNFDGYSVSALGLAEDFAALKKLIISLYRATTKPLIIGPDMAYQYPFGEVYPEYMSEFFAIASEFVDAVSWHYYPLVSEKCADREIDPWYATPHRLAEPGTLDEILKWSQKIYTAQQKYARGKPLWLGETASASCGGEYGVSDVFVSGMWYFDQLGLMARNYQQLMARQDLIGSYYGLLNSTTLFPNTDYWNTLIWQQAMGDASLITASNDVNTRAYTHCTPDTSNGTVSLVVINLNKEAVDVVLNVPTYFRSEYVMTADSLTADTMYLNGNHLVVVDGIYPTIKPRQIVGPLPITLPPQSYAIYILPQAAAKACMA